MKLAILLAFAVVCVSMAAASTNYRADFETFKMKYNKKYATTEEDTKRFNVFVQNMIVAAGHQAANPHATFGANIFSDMSAEEFKVYHRAERYYAAQNTTGPLYAPKGTAGEKVDWREKGAVTAVKNQGQCGSCWAFSSTGNIEGQWKLKGNALVSLSEQELVSCDTTDDGCNGGLMDNAWAWLVKEKGGWIETEASYPYVSGGGFAPSCNKRDKKNGARITGHKDIQKNENDMATFVFHEGPLSIGVDATSFQTYNSGILTNCISQSVDHGVLIVGFDTTHNPPYWIIKNSWGESWGEKGYIRVEKGRNECLITKFPCTSIAA